MKKTIAFGFSICVLAVFLTYCFAGNYDVEVNPQVQVEPYKSDAVRMSESYERIINRYQDMIEKHLLTQQQPSTEVIEKLEKIDKKIDSLSQRLTKIEIALKINNTEPNDIITPAKKATPAAGNK